MTDRSGQYHAALASPRRRQVLDALLASPEPLDAAAVAARLGLHITTARFHLDQLAAAGLAHRRQGVEPRRGRPRMLYAPTGAPRDEDARGQLIDVLAAALAVTADHAAESVMAGHRWADSFDRPDPADPIPGLVGVLDRLGFEPEPGADEIRLRACPFREAAREHPDVVCAVHRGLVDELLGGAVPNARLLPFVEPELCLVTLGASAERR